MQHVSGQMSSMGLCMQRKERPITKKYITVYDHQQWLLLTASDCSE